MPPSHSVLRPSNMGSFEATSNDLARDGSKSCRNPSIHPGTMMPSGAEPEEVDVTIFYVQTSDLQAFVAPKEVSCSLSKALDTENWTAACSALLDTRRLALHHPDDLIKILDEVLPMIIKHMNSLRSSLCKTALICAADLFKFCSNFMAFQPHKRCLSCFCTCKVLTAKCALLLQFVWQTLLIKL